MKGGVSVERVDGVSLVEGMSVGGAWDTSGCCGSS